MPEPSVGIELISTAVAKGVETGVTETFKLLHALLDAPLRESGEYLREVIADRRAARRDRVLGKVLSKARDAGFEPRAVPDAVVVPLLEAASLEEEPNLQEMWANLLANAADPRKRMEVRPRFIETLRGLTAGEARFLDALCSPHPVLGRGLSGPQISQAATDAGIARLQPGVGSNAGYPSSPDWTEGRASIAAVLDNFCGLGLMERVTQIMPVDAEKIRHKIENQSPIFRLPKLEINTAVAFYFTQLGADFIIACRAPYKPGQAS